MPTYLYECSKCNDQFEVDQRITEDPLTTCHCGSVGTVRRLIQPTAILFKGSGFYVNDSQKPSPTTPANDKPPTGTVEPATTPAPATASTPPSDSAPTTESTPATPAPSTEP